MTIKKFRRKQRSWEILGYIFFSLFHSFNFYIFVYFISKRVILFYLYTLTYAQLLFSSLIISFLKKKLSLYIHKICINICIYTFKHLGRYTLIVTVPKIKFIFLNRNLSKFFITETILRGLETLRG